MTDRIRQILVILGVVVMVLSSLWLGDSLDQGSDPTPVYFLPFGLTFAIWGAIYSGSVLYAIYQALPTQTSRNLHRAVGGWAALNYWLTALWNFTAGQAGSESTAEFQPIFVLLTVPILLGMLYSLTRTFIYFRRGHANLNPTDRWLAQVPLTIFFAWLNVATIANTTAALDAVGITGEPNGGLIAAALLLVALLLASAMVLFTRAGIGTIAYALVIVWAAFGILMNNLERSTPVIVMSLAVIVVTIIVTWFHFANRPAELSARQLTSS